MVSENSCCYCQYRELQYRLCQNRLDVETIHFCLKIDSCLNKDNGEICPFFELHDEIKEEIENKTMKEKIIPYIVVGIVVMIWIFGWILMGLQK